MALVGIEVAQEREVAPPRSAVAMSAISSSTMPPQRSLAAQAGSRSAISAAARIQ
jgi:hypothetical protein